jgi:hypothetical protein
MPVTSAGLNVVLSWASSVTNGGGFGARTQGPDSLDFNLAGLNLTTFNQIWAGDVTIAGGSHLDFDVTSPPAASPAVSAGQNLNSESVNFGHIEAIAAIANGGNCMITLASANPLLPPFGGETSASITLTGLFAWTNGTGTDTVGLPTSGTHKTFRLNNLGAGTATVSVGIVGGP